MVLHYIHLPFDHHLSQVSQSIINFHKHKTELLKKSQDFISMLPSHILGGFVCLEKTKNLASLIPFHI